MTTGEYGYFEREYAFHGVNVRIVTDSRNIHGHLDYLMHPFRQETTSNGGDLFVLYFWKRAVCPELGAGIGQLPKDVDVKQRAFTERQTLYYRYHEGRLYFSVDNAAHACLAPEDRQCVICINSAILDRHPISITKLFVLVLTEVVSRYGWFFLHGGALLSEAGGVCVLGPGGSGKTSLLLNMLRTGRFRFVSDDQVLINRESSVFSFTDKVSVSAKTLSLFAELRDLLNKIDRSRPNKHLMSIEDMYENSYADCCAPRYLVFVNTSDGNRPRSYPLDADVALRATLQESSLLLDENLMLDHAETVSRFVAGRTCIGLDLNFDVNASMALMESIIGGGQA